MLEYLTESHNWQQHKSGWHRNRKFYQFSYRTDCQHNLLCSGLCNQQRRHSLRKSGFIYNIGLHPDYRTERQPCLWQCHCERNKTTDIHHQQYRQFPADGQFHILSCRICRELERNNCRRRFPARNRNLCPGRCPELHRHGDSQF